MKTFLQIVWCLGIATPLLAAPTRVSAVGELKAQSCAPRIEGQASEILQQIGAQRGNASVGFYRDLLAVLREAGIPLPRAESLVAKLASVKEETRHLPVITNIFDVMSGLDQSGALLVCTVNEDCSYAKNQDNKAAFLSQDHAGMVVMPPQPAVRKIDWAMNFLSTMAAFTGEYYLLDWATANLHLERTMAGSSDEYYRRYLSKFDGTFPLPDDSHAGFARVFLMFYRDIAMQTLLELYAPEIANHNKNVRARLTIEDIERDSQTKPLLNELGVSPATYFERADAIFSTVSESILKFRRMR